MASASGNVMLEGGDMEFWRASLEAQMGSSANGAVVVAAVGIVGADMEAWKSNAWGLWSDCPKEVIGFDVVVGLGQSIANVCEDWAWVVDMA